MIDDSLLENGQQDLSWILPGLISHHQGYLPVHRNVPGLILPRFRMQGLDFAKEMIQSPEAQRLSAEEALESFWLRGKQNGCCTIN